MTIEVATPAVQYELRRRATIAADATQRFANRADPITAAQAVAVDAACAALVTALTAAGFGAPADPLVAPVSDGASLLVKNSSGTETQTGTATVALSAVTGVVLPATVAILGDTRTTTVQNSAGVLSSTGTAAVAGGIITSIRLGATKTILTSGTKVNVGTAFTGSGAFLTPTIANGVLTGGVLSAS